RPTPPPPPTPPHDCIDRLSEYQMDRNIFDSSDLGQVILERKQGGITSYGAISGRGQELYSVLTVQPEQELSGDLDEDENCEMGMNL
ncbi:MAG: hypothetical protein K2G83_03450, partial [Ruminococcus sp.]|nr:hypothetical protein [Ruminococcus sp.]